MSRWRSYVILLFLLLPVLIFLGVGGWAMWETGRLFWMWFVLPAGWGVAFLLAKWWGEKLVPLPSVDTKPELHWTPRDKKAWECVDARIQSAVDIDPVNFTKVDFYVETARELSEEIARHYHPKATDPFSSLTIPEITAAGQLALEDLSELYDQYVPGGHVLTINHLRRIAKLPKQYKIASNIANVAAAFFSPLAAAGRYVASRTVMAPIARAMQSNLLNWFYTLFLQRVGFYLIEMNSGRLRGGSKKFREAYDRLSKSKQRPWEDAIESTVVPPPQQPTETDGQQESAAKAHGSHPVGTSPDDQPQSPVETTSDDITVCVIGQARSGKSSVIRGLLNDAQQDAQQLDKSPSITVHRLALPDSDERLRLLDTAGYGSGDEARSQKKDRFRAIAQSDLVLLVTNATSPARDADVRFLEEMSAWFVEHPQWKPPAVIVVLSHIDLLKPTMEWSPPYNWAEPTERKEESIRDAMEHVRGEFGERVIDVIPVCSDIAGEREFGLREWLEPAVIVALDEARACSTVRQLHQEIETGKLQRVLGQVWNIGKALRGK